MRLHRRLVAGIVAVALWLCASCDSDKKQPITPARPPDVFIFVPAGTFLQGSPTDEPGRGTDETQHSVALNGPFRIGRCEVTQSEWQSVMGWVDAAFPGSDRPVERVSWYDCVSFCNLRSAREGLTPAYTVSDPAYSGDHLIDATVIWNPGADGYRLPTEAEWEYACRAASVTAFCSGAIADAGDPGVLPDCTGDANLDRVGWYCANSAGATHAVSGKTANAWGLQDMHGNVQEWCWDWRGDYPGGAVVDSGGPFSGSRRVARGGSWGSLARTCRSAFRYSERPGVGTHSIGLRLVRTAE